MMKRLAAPLDSRHRRLGLAAILVAATLWKAPDALAVGASPTFAGGRTHVAAVDGLTAAGDGSSVPDSDLA